MKKYEYRFIEQEAKLVFVQPKNIEDAEKEWSEPGGNFVKKIMED